VDASAGAEEKVAAAQKSVKTTFQCFLQSIKYHNILIIVWQTYFFHQSISNQNKKPVDEIRVSEPAMKRPPRQKKPDLLRFLVEFLLLTLPPQAGCLRNLLTKLLVSA
jgi:hypothetical protein